MKYIKNFENSIENTDKMFYKVNIPITEIKLNALLWKLGQNPEDNKSYVKSVVSGEIFTGIDSFDYFYLSINEKEVKLLRLSWMRGDENGFNYYVSRNYKYGGEIEVTDEDIENYNISLNIKKYNL